MSAATILSLKKLLLQARDIKSIKYRGLIIYEVFKDWEIGETRNLDGVCLTTKLSESSEKIVLIAVVLPLSKMKWHAHDCLEELETLEGEITIEPADDGTIQINNNTISIPPYVMHEVSNSKKNPLKIKITLFNPR